MDGPSSSPVISARRLRSAAGTASSVLAHGDRPAARSPPLVARLPSTAMESSRPSCPTFTVLRDRLRAFAASRHAAMTSAGGRRPTPRSRRRTVTRRLPRTPRRRRSPRRLRPGTTGTTGMGRRRRRRGPPSRYPPARTPTPPSHDLPPRLERAGFRDDPGQVRPRHRDVPHRVRRDRGARGRRERPRRVLRDAHVVHARPAVHEQREHRRSRGPPGPIASASGTASRVASSSAGTTLAARSSAAARGTGARGMRREEGRRTVAGGQGRPDLRGRRPGEAHEGRRWKVTVREKWMRKVEEKLSRPNAKWNFCPCVTLKLLPPWWRSATPRQLER